MTDTLTIRRVLLVARCYADAADALPIALALARLARAELSGVLAEDPHALDASSHVVLFKHADSAAAPGKERMQAAFRADARAFEARLSLLARRASLTWRFGTEPGTPADLVRRLSTRDDVVLLGYRRVLRSRGPVIALCRPGEDAAEKLATALASALGVQVLVMRVGESGAEAQLASWMARSVVTVPDEAAALNMLDSLSPSGVVIGSGLEAFSGPAALESLVQTARCPVLLRLDTQDKEAMARAPNLPRT